MKIDTTINISNDLLEVLERAVLLTGKSKSLIISLLMVRLAQRHDRYINTWKQVRYQARCKRGNYRRMHLYLKDEEYELFIDLRKFCKQSVSSLVSHVIKSYLHEITSNTDKESSNYPRINYAMEKVAKDEFVCWILKWGISINQVKPETYNT